MTSKKLILPLILMLFVLFSCSGLNVENTPDDEIISKATEIGNMNNLGYAVVDESANIYYISTSEGHKNNLCGPQTAIGEEEVLFGQEDVLKIFCKKQDWIYFLKGDCRLYRVNVETKETEMIFDAHVNQMIEFHGSFYCAALSPEPGLWKLDIDESGNCESEQLVEGRIRNLAVDGDKIYYTADQTLYADPHAPTLIASGINEDWLYILQGIPYFVANTDQKLYSIENGTIIEADPSNLKIYYMNVAGDKFILVAMGDSTALHTYLFDPITRKTELFSPYGYGDIFVADRDVYELLLSDNGLSIRLVGKLKN